MSSGFHVAGQSFVHKMHPVTRIVCLLLSFASAMIINHPLWLFALALIYAPIGVRAGVLAGLRTAAWLMVLIGLASFMIWSVAYAGKTAAASAGPLSITYEGMIFGAGMGMRINLMLFCGLIFLAATPVEDFTYGLTRMGLPFSMSFALSLSFRLAPLFGGTIQTIVDAQRARGLDTGAGGVITRIRSYVPLLVPVFAGALRRTDQLALALESKGFGLGRRRGSFREYTVGTTDALAIAALMAIIALEVVARRFGLGMIG